MENKMEKLTIEESKQLKELYKRFFRELSEKALWRHDIEALVRVKELMDRFLMREKDNN